mmetsp:Transcript_85218/g.264792  ORF Transcript_85218/g.264792 Transcript_85218/m.264792 type:complete len:264 (-) Transcript_85218:678-1469(-)
MPPWLLRMASNKHWSFAPPPAIARCGRWRPGCPRASARRRPTGRLGGPGRLHSCASGWSRSSTPPPGRRPGAVQGPCASRPRRCRRAASASGSGRASPRSALIAMRGSVSGAHGPSLARATSPPACRHAAAASSWRSCRRASAGCGPGGSGLGTFPSWCTCWWALCSSTAGRSLVRAVQCMPLWAVWARLHLWLPCSYSGSRGSCEEQFGMWCPSVEPSPRCQSSSLPSSRRSATTSSGHSCFTARAGRPRISMPGIPSLSCP